jgi:uridine phosphorylase
MLRKSVITGGTLCITAFTRGVPITICNTGIGGPSAAIAIEELINCGAKTIIRVGSGGVLRKNINTGDLVISTGVCKEEKQRLLTSI